MLDSLVTVLEFLFLIFYNPTYFTLLSVIPLCIYVNHVISEKYDKPLFDDLADGFLPIIYILVLVVASYFQFEIIRYFSRLVWGKQIDFVVILKSIGLITSIIFLFYIQYNLSKDLFKNPELLKKFGTSSLSDIVSIVFLFWLFCICLWLSIIILPIQFGLTIHIFEVKFEDKFGFLAMFFLLFGILLALLGAMRKLFTWIFFENIWLRSPETIVL